MMPVTLGALTSSSVSIDRRRWGHAAETEGTRLAAARAGQVTGPEGAPGRRIRPVLPESFRRTAADGLQIFIETNQLRDPDLTT